MYDVKAQFPHNSFTQMVDGEELARQVPRNRSLMDEIRKYPTTYDKSNSQYKDQWVKKNAFQKVTQNIRRFSSTEIS